MATKLKNVENEYGIKSEYGHFIGGEWISGDSGKTIDLINPATGAVLTKIQAGNAKDIQRAVAAAKAAFPKWSESSPAERQEILIEVARRLKARHQHYATLETLNNGKPIRESMYFDMPQAIGQFELFAGAAYGLHGQTLDFPDAVGIVHREPLGVCAQIIPWNVPMLMMACKIAPALASGNTVVLKPAETVCLSVIEFFVEMADLLPPGVINVVTGYGPDVGEALVTHEDVRKVAFTGRRPAGSCNMHPPISSRRRSNWAVSPRTSFVGMLISMPRSKVPRCRPCSTKAKFAWLAHACSCTSRSRMSSLRSSRWRSKVFVRAIRWTLRPSSAHRRRRCKWTRSRAISSWLPKKAPPF